MGAWPQLSGGDGIRALTQADDVAEAVRGGLAPPDAPLALRRACEAAMVRVMRRPLAIGRHRHSAMLVPTRDGFHAVVDSGIWQRAREGSPGRHRLRFVLAHELGHTFFYGPGRPPTRPRPPDRLEERFCHRFATSLLVPPVAARETALDPVALRGLAERYDVSTRVAAWAIARARPHVTLLWLQQAPHPVHGGQETMRVQWGASERFIPHGESFKSPLARLASDGHGQSIETLRLAGREEQVRIDAWRFAQSMLVILQPPNVEAMRLRS